MIKDAPYKLIWGTIPIILILALAGWNKDFDIQLHDVYFVAAMPYIGLPFATFLGFIGFIYWRLRNRRLVPWLTIAHVIITITTILIIMIYALAFKNTTNGNLDYFSKVNKIASASLLISVLSQLFLLINIGIGLMRS